MTSMAALRRLLAIVVCALALGGCRFGGPVSLLDDDDAIAKALSGIQSRYPGPMPTLKVTISDTELVVQAEGPGTPGQIVQWQMQREHYLLVNIDHVRGPRPIDPVLMNRNVQENLFDLKGVNFAAWGKFAEAAVGHAKLEDRSGVASVELSRPAILLPSPSSGPVRWIFEVKSVRESARIFANADGQITGANLNGTIRMRNLNMYQRPELAADAAVDVRRYFGAKPVLLRVSFSSTSIGFETTVDDKKHFLASSGSLRINAVYNWSLNGLSQTMGRPSIGGHMSNPNAAFGVDEVDWAMLPKIVADAQSKLAMTNGRVTSINLTKPTDGVGEPALIWDIDIEANRERGSYKADVKGVMKAVSLPPSRRKPAEWLNPETVMQSLVRIGEEFGPGTRIVEITFNDRNGSILAEDPRKPGTPVRVLLGDNGFSRFGMAMLLGTGKPYTMDDLKPLSVQRLAAMAERTLETLKMPPGSVIRYTIGRGFTQTSPKGTITVEVRAESQHRGHGWVVFELDGEVVSVMRP